MNQHAAVVILYLAPEGNIGQGGWIRTSVSKFQTSWINQLSHTKT